MTKSPIHQQFELARKQALIERGLLDESGREFDNTYRKELAQLNEEPTIFSHRNDDIHAPAIDYAQPLWQNIWFENECACLFGDPNIGKSTLAFQIACNVAATGRNTVYFDFENMMHHYRTRNWAPEQFVKPENLFVQHFSQDATFEQMTDRRRILKDIEKEFLDLNAPVIIIDDITQICPLRNCNKTQRVLRQLRQWLNKYHLSILVIAHASHHQEGTPLAMKHLTGDRQLAYAFDSIISLNDIPAGTTPDGATHYIKQLKARNAPIQMHDEAVTTLRLKDSYDEEACRLLTETCRGEGCDEKALQAEIDQVRGRKFFHFITLQTDVCETQLLYLPLDATPEQRLTFIHDTFAKGWSIRTIAAHSLMPKSTVHRLLATPKNSVETIPESSPSKIEGDTGGVCPTEQDGGVCQEEKSSPSKIDQWCKPNAEVCESSPSKIEGDTGGVCLEEKEKQKSSSFDMGVDEGVCQSDSNARENEKVGGASHPRVNALQKNILNLSHYPQKKT